MYSDILSNIKTTFDVWQLEQEIDLLLESFYSSDEGKFNQTLDKNVRSWASESLKRVFADESIKKDQYLTDLKKKLKELKKLKLTLAYEPNQNSLENVNDWVKANVGKNVILEITLNPSIFAGAIITYEGNYRDLSLRKRFRKEFEDSRESIFKLLGG